MALCVALCLGYAAAIGCVPAGVHKSSFLVPIPTGVSDNPPPLVHCPLWMNVVEEQTLPRRRLCIAFCYAPLFTASPPPPPPPPPCRPPPPPNPPPPPPSPPRGGGAFLGPYRAGAYGTALYGWHCMQGVGGYIWVGKLFSPCAMDQPI